MRNSFGNKLFFKLICSFYIYAINQFVSATITVFDEKNITLNSYDDLASGFGPNLPDEGFQGYIAIAKPLDGCTRIERPPNVSYVNPHSWIALIQRTPGSRSNCTFDLKVYNAQQAGYSVVIIYNVESDTLIKMSSSGLYSIKIPSVFVGQTTANEIKAFFTYQNKTYVRINNDDADFNYLLIPFVCVVSVCFLVAIFIFLIKFAIHCHKIRKNRFPRSALKKIPTKKYQKTDKYDTCPICLNEYEEGVKIRILPCEHAYHIECIDKWLLRNNRACPVCKRRVIPGGSDSESEDSYNPTSTHTSLLDRQTNTEEHDPNEEDDTNESSRLLISTTSNNNRNLDENSVSTTITHINSNIVSINNDISSLNNQMTTSMNSNLANQNNRTELRSSSSKYGSISSINNLVNANSNFTNSSSKEIIDDSNLVNSKINYSSQIIDSKATPEFFTPNDSDCAGLIVNSVEGSSSSFATNNLDNQLQLKSISQNKDSKSNSKTKQNKSKASKKNNKIASSSSSSNSNANNVRIRTNEASNAKASKSDKSKDKSKDAETRRDETTTVNTKNEKANCSSKPESLLKKSSRSSSTSSILIDLNEEDKLPKKSGDDDDPAKIV